MLRKTSKLFKEKKKLIHSFNCMYMLMIQVHKISSKSLYMNVLNMQKQTLSVSAKTKT